MIWIIITIVGIILDRASKYIIDTSVEIGNSITVIEHFFYITNYQNSGAAMGILQNGRIFFLIFTPLVLIIFAYFMYNTKSNLLKFSLALAMSGAIGNYIDRLVKGTVTDFLMVIIGNYHMPIFNIADAILVIGSILLAIYLLFIYKEPKRRKSKYKL